MQRNLPYSKRTNGWLAYRRLEQAAFSRCEGCSHTSAHSCRTPVRIYPMTPSAFRLVAGNFQEAGVGSIDLSSGRQGASWASRPVLLSTNFRTLVDWKSGRGTCHV